VVVSRIPETRRQRARDPGAGPLPARDKAFARGGLFGEKGDGAAKLAADRKPLNQAGDQDQDRRREPDRRITRHQCRHRCADDHQQDREGEPGLAAGAIGIGTDRDRAERAHQKRNAEGAESQQQRRGLVAAREEHFRYRDREIAVDEKIEPF